MKVLAAAVDAGPTSCPVRHERRLAPVDISRIVKEVRKATSTAIGIHTHNDGEMAVANSLAAVESGATQVQGRSTGTGNGAGTRTSARSSPRWSSRWVGRSFRRGSCGS